MYDTMSYSLSATRRLHLYKETSELDLIYDSPKLAKNNNIVVWLLGAVTSLIYGCPCLFLGTNISPFCRNVWKRIYAYPFSWIAGKKIYPFLNDIV